MPRRNRGAYLQWIEKRGCWYIQWYDGGAKRQRSTGTADSVEAEAKLAAFIAERYRPATNAGPCDPAHYPIADALTLYMEEHAPETTAPERIAYAIEALVPFWGETMASAVSQETCRAYARKRGKSDGTIRKELGTLRAALNHAYRYGRITRVPHFFMPARPEGRERWLTRSEAAALLQQAVRSRSDTRLYLPLFIVLALYTGARKEAILSLQWRQVDLDNRLIDFNPKGRKQTGKRRPKQPISDRLMTFLRLARRRGDSFGYVVHRDGMRIKDIGDAKGGSFGRACIAAGLYDVSPHTLRHTCATWLAQSGVPLHKIAGWLGHSTAHVTERYAHHSPEHLADVRRAVDRRR